MDTTTVQLDGVHSSLLSATDAQRTINNILMNSEGLLATALAFARVEENEQPQLDCDLQARTATDLPDEPFIRVFHTKDESASPFSVDWARLRERAEVAADTSVRATRVAGKLALGGILKLDALCGTLIEDARSRVTTLVHGAPSLALEPALASIRERASDNDRPVMRTMPHVARTKTASPDNVYDVAQDERKPMQRHTTVRVPIQGRHTGRIQPVHIRTQGNVLPSVRELPVKHDVIRTEQEHPIRAHTDVVHAQGNGLVYLVAFALVYRKLVRGTR